MMWKTVVVALALSVATSAAEAKQDYAAYEGRDAVQEGQGGTKVQEHGVDFWTTGAPARRFQVLGILTDARKDRKFDGSAIGSKAVAKKVLEVGGNAVIVAGADTQAAGVSTIHNAFANGGGVTAVGSGRVVNRTTTRLIVVKYLDQ